MVRGRQLPRWPTEQRDNWMPQAEGKPRFAANSHVEKDRKLSSVGYRYKFVSCCDLWGSEAQYLGSLLTFIFFLNQSFFLSFSIHHLITFFCHSPYIPRPVLFVVAFLFLVKKKQFPNLFHIGWLQIPTPIPWPFYTYNMSYEVTPNRSRCLTYA